MKLSKVILSVFLAMLMSVSFISCGKEDDETASSNTEFNFTIETYKKALKTAIGDTNALQDPETYPVDENGKQVAERWAIADSLSLVMTYNGKNGNLQNVILWLEYEGTENNNSMYNFGGYSKFLAASIAGSETEYEKILSDLKIGEDTPYQSQYMYRNDEFLIFNIHDYYGYRILIVPPESVEDFDTLLTGEGETGISSEVPSSEETASDIENSATSEAE